MHRTRPSRSRILFEVFCALVVVASCVGAWMQTGASALLLAAAASALYAMVHLFDLAERGADVAIEPQRIDFATDGQADLLAYEDASMPLAGSDQQLQTDKGTEQAELVDALQESGTRRTKAPRKSGGRRARATKETKATELAPLDDAEIASIQPEAAEADPPMAYEEVAHPHIEALFEPEPFARMPRRAFGRKSG